MLKCKDCLLFKTRILTPENFKETDFQDYHIIEKWFREMQEDGLVPQVKVWWCAKQMKPIYDKKKAMDKLSQDCKYEEPAVSIN